MPMLAYIAAALLDFLDDQSAFLASVVGELACRKLECAANDFRTNSWLPANTRTW
jgi:hypothetical protein